MLGKGILVALRALFAKPGDNGDLVDECEYFRWLKTELWERLAIKAWRVASVIESVDTEVTEL